MRILQEESITKLKDEHRPLVAFAVMILLMIIFVALWIWTHQPPKPIEPGFVITRG